MVYKIILNDQWCLNEAGGMKKFKESKNFENAMQNSKYDDGAQTQIK
jgi:hypothetical protein